MACLSKNSLEIVIKIRSLLMHFQNRAFLDNEVPSFPIERCCATAYHKPAIILISITNSHGLNALLPISWSASKKLLVKGQMKLIVWTTKERVRWIEGWTGLGLGWAGWGGAGLGWSRLG